ncbi:hypothetical protein [Caldicellulosiruptor morganii]|uniref:Uncharacterized protein n=1 Tax=Caldicellulosiruptor morganii TaxID=1387555 RepID=A0ABY7BRR4_9FIRM|nr:hypothetical protein [Caldicellulosiruptor morganii]WAM33811.1 hypothetical protein OTK00_002355 [Caldicellulosiruptor morganii]
MKAALAKERDEAYSGNKDTIERAYTVYVTLLDLIAENESKFVEML